MQLLMMVWLLATWFVAPAHATTPEPALGPGPDVAFKDGKSKEEEEKEMSAAEKEAERKRKEKLARVIVLKWPDNKTVDYTDSTIQRNVKSRIARPEAQFFPEVDLYQNGRKVKDKTVVPAMQPAMVPDQNLQRVRAAVDEVAGIPWNAMQPDQWGIKAQELRDMVELVWFDDKVDQREPLFLLYSQIGRAAENQNQNIPPFYEQIGAMPVNYYFYLAATLAYQDPALMSKLTDQELNGAVAYILQQLQQGAFPTLKLDFELENEFDEESFNKAYELYLNGIKTELTEQGQHEIFLGRTDIYLKRVDNGHGLSERLEVTKLEESVFFPMNVAQKKMGYDFIEQLFLHPNECTPALDGDILNYLAIYAKLHEKAEIYIAVPQYGNPNKVWVWRYDRPSANLQLVGGAGGGFPVRFAAVVMGGIMYNGASPAYDEQAYQEALQAQGTDPGAMPSPASAVDPNLMPAYVPVNFELRGHYNRLMVAFGAEFGFNANASEAPWYENFFLPGKMDADVTRLKEREVTDEDTNGDGTVTEEDAYTELVGSERLYHTTSINRNMYLGVSAVLGRDAGVGFGPRLGARIGWTNVPHALQTTAHFGWNFPMPMVKAPGERVRPFLDVDGRAGVSWPFKYSVAHTSTVTVKPVFGIVAGVGSTF